MSIATIAALLALATSLVIRRRRARSELSLDDWAMALGLQLGLVAVIATGLAWVGLFRPLQFALACGLTALACWPWATPRTGESPGPRDEGRGTGPSRRLSAALLLVIVVGVALRSPPIAAPLAGRDQGSYALRAASSLRTGSLGWTDPVLAQAGRELAGRETPAGALDILGLYPSTEHSWREGVYEGAYRPGSYLADREAGEVTPQFFHLHPMLLSVGLLGFGRSGVAITVAWVGALWLLALACVARRLWPRGPAAVLALSLVAISPLAIWTARMPLSENPMALLEALAVLVALRVAAKVEPETGPWWLAAYLGLSAGVRGNAWMILPVVLALAWLRPRTRGAGAARLVLAAVVASALVHALTVYPYVYDELMRRLPVEDLGPGALIAAVGLGAGAWLGVDAAFAVSRGKQLRARILAATPPVLGLALGLALLAWAGLKIASPDGPPYSRLDAAPILLGLPLSLLALVGIASLAWRWRPTPAQTWLVALAAIVPATAWIYVPRGLPTLAFFYYGRYLVPELVPVACLAAVHALVELDGLARRRWSSPRWARALVGALGLGLVASVGGPLLAYPQLRLREYEPAGDALAWLDAQIEADAIVIAGGEGWHSGHTHNQVGGALAMGYGRALVPYRTREDAYLSAWELLVAGPKRRGTEAPPVYLLVNEAAHPYTREGGERVALVDDLLWAPFVAERVDLLELYVHALTPAPDRLPTRVARHELRMALVELRVDPEALAAIETLRFDGRETCVSADEVLRLELPRPADAAHIIVEAGEVDVALARAVPRWRVRIDGQLLAFEAPRGLRGHPRASLGPAPLPPAEPGATTMELEIRGAGQGDDAGASCPGGRLAAVRLLPRERGWFDELDDEAIDAVTFAPRRDLGHAIEPITWVGGRSLNRYRAGTEPPPTLAGLALVLEAGAALEFGAIDLPVDASGEPAPVDLVVTLARTRTASGARLRITADGAVIGELEVPPQRARSWVGAPLRWRPLEPRARLRVELLPSPESSATAGTAAVDVRDIALFGRGGSVESRVH